MIRFVLADYTLKILSSQGCYRDSILTPELTLVWSDDGNPAVTLTDLMCEEMCQQRGNKVSGVQVSCAGYFFFESDENSVHIIICFKYYY